MKKDAGFSDCRKYRYWLLRRWDDEPLLNVIGLNPSTADEEKDDPTIRRIMGFARGWKYGGIQMLNLFSYRATDPKDMMRAEDPVGPNHDDLTRFFSKESNTIFCCWGTHGGYLDRDKYVMSMMDVNYFPFCLGTTKAGYPKHPLYLPKKERPVYYAGRYLEQLNKVLR